MKMQTIMNSAKLAVNRGGLVLRKHSPEILVGVGIIGLVAATVSACKQTTHAEEILDEMREDLAMVSQAVERASVEDYGEDEQKKDRIIIYTQTSVKFIKLYSGPVLLGAVSIAMILGGHNILRKRHIAMISAYKSLEEGFKNYRKRVVDEYGAEKDFQYRNGIYAEKVLNTTVDENGVEVVTEGSSITIDPNMHSQYARFFDEGSRNWTKTPEHNLIFVRAQQNYANDLLHSRGHVFLNEVYDMLGIDRSQAGSVVGWVLDKDSDNYIDFGIYDLSSDGARDFVNGRERSILLDFNVSGVIFDKI